MRYNRRVTPLARRFALSREESYAGFMRTLARFALALLLAVSVAPQVVGAASARSGGDVIVPLQQTTTDDMYLSGNNVRIEGTVTGDVVTAGRTVVINGHVTGDVWALAETVEIR